MFKSLPAFESQLTLCDLGKSPPLSGPYGINGNANIADGCEDEMKKSMTNPGLGAPGEGKSQKLIYLEQNFPLKILYPLLSQPQAFIFFDDTRAVSLGGGGNHTIVRK